MAVGGIVPVSVKDPALRTLLEQLISATGIGSTASTSSKVGDQWRISEGPYPNNSSSNQFLLQWRNGTRWDTKAALSANGIFTTVGGSTSGGDLTVNGNLTVTGTETVNGAETVGGNITFTNTASASSVGFGKVIGPGNLTRAWAFMTLQAATAVTINDGYNIQGATWDNSGTVTVTMATALSNANYGIIVTFQNRANGASFVNFTCNATSSSVFVFQSSVVMGTGTNVSCFVIGK